MRWTWLRRLAYRGQHHPAVAARKPPGNGHAAARVAEREQRKLAETYRTSATVRTTLDAFGDEIDRALGVHR